MAIKITYLELAAASAGLLKIRAIDKKTCQSPVDRARIARFTQAVIKELAEYEKLRNELLMECGKLIEKAEGNSGGQHFRIEPDKIEKFRDEMLKLNAVEAEIQTAPLPTALWNLADLTVDEMNGLGPLIELPPEEAAAPDATPEPPTPLKPV